MNYNAIPEPIHGDERSKRSTTEWCAQQHTGYRCMLVKDHPGPHEAIGNQGVRSWPLASTATEPIVDPRSHEPR